MPPRVPASGTLSGRTVIITRAAETSGPLARALEERGAQVVIAPALSLAEPLDWGSADAALARLGSYDIIIFTSANAVERFQERARVLGTDLAGLAARIVAIGPATAAALERAGLRVESLPHESRAEGLIDTLAGEPLEGRRILLPRAESARELLVETLRARGAAIDVVPVYRTLGAPLEPRVKQLLESGGADLVIFASGSAVAHFLAAAGGVAALRGTAVAALGPVTAEAAADLGLTVDIVGRAGDTEETVAAIESYCARASQPRSAPGSSSCGSSPR